MCVEIQPCNCKYYDVILTFYVINRPGANFCMSLSIWTGTAYLPDQVWLHKLNPEVFCDIARHFVQSNCSSKCSVGRNLSMYTMSDNGNKIMRENMHDVHLLLFFSKTYFPLNVCYISMHWHKTVKQCKIFRQNTYQTQNFLMEGMDLPPPPPPPIIMVS